MKRLRRKVFLSVALVCLVGFFAFGGSSCGSSGTAAVAFALASNDITAGAAMAAAYAAVACGGNNISPQLRWTDSPAGALAFAVTLLDLSANNFVHWIIWNIPATTTSLDQNASANPPAGTGQATNAYGDFGYGGPCPPATETHTYQFKVWALAITDVTAMGGFDANDNASILAILEANSVGTATLDVTYTGP